ncbi:MAG: 23S rRNA (cytidine(2498)-2'-O)-methyltransferase RlmM [Pseudomonadota bacterium]
MPSLFAVCRPGFEKECIAALGEACARRGVAGFGRARPETGYAQFVLQETADGPVDAAALLASLHCDELVFARDLFLASDPVAIEPPDRLLGIRPHLAGLPPLASVQLGAPDTNDGRELAALLRQLERPLRAALAEQGVRTGDRYQTRLLLFLADGATAFICTGRMDQAPPWPLGVPRLKLLREAPSRSALKLEEAWHLFIPRQEWATRLGPGRTAVDLGAAPGGWTWQMIRRGMRVEAVDNGPLAPVVADDPLVTHHRADGFTFQPKRPVDWLVCDMVEKPARVTALIARWLVRGWTRQAIFNLKLPMKSRHAETQLNLARLADELEAAGLAFELQARQLYHDREEITVCVRVTGRTAP